MYSKSLMSVLAIVAQVLLLQCCLDGCLAGKSKESKELKPGSLKIDQFLNMKYELDKSENFEAVMEAFGLNWFMRKAGNLAQPIMELTKKGDTYSLTSKSSFKNTDTKFKLGEEFNDETPDGRKVKSLITVEDNKLIQIQKGKKTTKLVREFTPEQVKLVITVTPDNIVSTRIYKRKP